MPKRKYTQPLDRNIGNNDTNIEPFHSYSSDQLKLKSRQKIVSTPEVAALAATKSTEPSHSSSHKRKRSRPKIFSLLYRAHRHETSGDDATSCRLWIEATERIRYRHTYASSSASPRLPEAQHRADGIFGRLPLHLAVEQGAPYSVVRALVEVYPEGCGVKFDATPLHLACAHPRRKTRERMGEKALGLEDDPDSEQVIRILMKTYPEAIGVEGGNDKSCTALHLILENKPSKDLVETMVDYYEKTAIDKDDGVKSIFHSKDIDGQLPLHVAVENQASDDVVRFIHRGYPGATKRARISHDGCFVLHSAVLFGQSEDCLTLIMESFPDALTSENNKRQTPLQMLFASENISRWHVKKNSRDSLGRERLTEKGICELLLRIYTKYHGNRALRIKKLLETQDCWGKTILDNAKECKESHPVPDDLISFLQEAGAGEISTLPWQTSLKADNNNSKLKKTGMNKRADGGEKASEQLGGNKLRKTGREELHGQANVTCIDMSCELSSEEEFEFE